MSTSQPSASPAAIANVAYGKTCRFLRLANPSREEFEYLSVGGRKSFAEDSNIAVWDWDEKWIWAGALELISPDGLSSSRGPRLSLVFHSDGEITFHFSYWARPLHRATTNAVFEITPEADTKTVLFRIPWGYTSPKNCPNALEVREGTAGFGRNDFDLAYWWFPNLKDATYWADCRPILSWEGARSLRLK